MKVEIVCDWLSPLWEGDLQCIPRVGDSVYFLGNTLGDINTYYVDSYGMDEPFKDDEELRYEFIVTGIQLHIYDNVESKYLVFTKVIDSFCHKETSPTRKD
jgi:hypothetical protein